MNKDVRQGYFRFLILQIALLFIVAFVSWAARGKEAFISSILAGVVFLLPNVYFAYKFFRHRGALMAKKIINAFYMGEAVKFILTVILFSLVFALYQVKPWPFFITYIVLQGAHWLSPLFINHRRHKRD